MSEEVQKISTALEFKKRYDAAEKGEIIELVGSGLSVRVRRPQINKLIAMGVIPDSLASFLIRADQSEVKPKDLPELLELQRTIAQYSIIEPKVVDKEANYEGGEISIDDLEDADVSSVWMWYSGGSEAVEKFRIDRKGIAARSDLPQVSESKT